MLIRSILLRFSQVLATCGSLYLSLIAMNLYLDRQPTAALGWFLVALGLLVAVGLLAILVYQFDPEMSAEAARVVYIGGALTTLVASFLLAMVQHELLQNKGSQALVLVLAGGCVFAFLIYKCFDIKWLRGIDEIRTMRGEIQEDDEVRW